MGLKEEIKELKAARDAVILSHYYTNDGVQGIADYIGDTYYLAKVATNLKNKVICFCGVLFMGECAKILNPSKTVLLPEPEADCPMVHTISAEDIRRAREKYDDLAVVCYVNSSAKTKALSDVCVTPSNSERVIRALPNKNIFFIPDANLGRHIAGEIPEKHFVFGEAFCHVHNGITQEMVLAVKMAHPNAEFLAHPGCTPEVLALADFIGSASRLIDHAASSANNKFIIGNELGVMCKLRYKKPEKAYYPAAPGLICPNMKKITLEKVRNCLRDMSGRVEIPEEERLAALRPLERMSELVKRAGQAAAPTELS